MEIDGRNLKIIVDSALEDVEVRKRFRDIDLSVDALLMCVELDDDLGVARVTAEPRDSIEAALRRDPLAVTLLAEFHKLREDQGCLVVMVMQAGKEPVASVMALSRYFLGKAGQA